MASVHELLAKKKELVDEARSIQTRVFGEQNGEWRGDDSAKFDGLMAQSDSVQADIERMAKLDAAERSLEEAEKPAERRSAPSNTERRPAMRVTEADRQEALRAWFMAGTPEGATEKQREAAQRCGISLSKSMTMSLPSHALRSDTAEGWAEWERRAALGTTSGAVGQYTVPDETMRALEASLLAFGGMRQVATVLRTASGAALPIPTVNDTGNSGEIIAENSVTNELEMTFAQIVLESYKYSSKYVLVSVELLQDSAINVAEFVGKALGERIARVTNLHFTTGDGSSKPRGIVAAAGDSTVTAASSTVFTYDELVDVVHSVDPAYRNNARFMLNDTTLKSLKKVKVLQYSGDSTGMPLWQPSMSAGTPDMLLGYPYVINQQMASPATTAKSLIFGDLSKYLIRDVRDVTLLRLDERFAEYHQVAFLAFSRHDGDLLDAGTDPVKWADHT